MKKMTYLLLLLIMLPMLVIAAKRPTRPDYHLKPLSRGIKAILNDALQSAPKHAHIGIIIQSMTSGKILYQKNQDQLFTPASIQKILTAVAALDYLKPDYTFKTQLLTNGHLVNHVLQGNLTVKFSGDPELSRKDLDQLIGQLHQQGIKKITGRINIDNTAYGNVPYPPGWIWDDLSYSFAAPLNTIIINRNYFLLKLIPPKKKNGRPTIETTLPEGVGVFSNLLELIKKPRKHCPIRIYSNNNNHYKVRGCFYQRWKKQTRKIAIRNMTRYAQALLAELFKKNNLAYPGHIQLKAIKKTDTVLAQHESSPLKEVIKEMIKESDNLMTNAVFKKLGQTYFKSRGTWQNSLRAVKKLLATPTHVDFTQNLINDGAGLSRYNLLSPKQLSKVLYYAYHKSTINNAFVDALPIGGKDGTMAYRLQDQRKDNRIHAKTGSMTGVTSLAGYIATKHYGPISFVIMINGFVKPRKPYILLEDQICRYLANAQQ
jgi:serine-type D-Ala-D-Ala carboxypeptidase/endopeptidase (penicillin-binding protein 4)